MRSGALRSLALVAAVAWLAACPAGTPAAPGSAAADPAAPAPAGAGAGPEIIPTPRQARFDGGLLPVGPLEVRGPADDPGALAARLRDLLGGAAPGGSPTTVVVGDARRNAETARLVPDDAGVADVSDRGPEAYRLILRPDPGRPGSTLLVLAGNSPVGDFWALQTLAQIVVERDGRKLVPRGAVADWPVFPRRGDKRPAVWEHRFKANYAWSWVGDDPAFREVHRTEGAWVHHVRELRLDEPGWVESLIASARAAHEKGVREFVLKYDDAERAMTPGTAELHGGYFAAQVAFLASVQGELMRLDPANRVYLMPQPYWADAFDLPEYGRGLEAAGGLPRGLGLSLTGSGVISRTIPREAVDLARRTLGLTGRKAQIYDNLPRGGDFTAYRGRDPDLAESVDCVFAERGTPITRITMYDYLWNPAAYDPERSLRLACRELAGRDPEIASALLEYVNLWNRERDRASFLPHDEAVEQVVRSTRLLRERYEALRPLLDRSPLARETGLAQSLLGGEKDGETAALADRERFLPPMIRDGYREGTARRAPSPPRIDGRLDDSAWSVAAPLGTFVYLRDTGRGGGPREVPDPRVEDGEQTEVLVLRDDENLYLGVRLHHASGRPTLPAGHRPGERAPGAWRDPSVEIMIDPDLDRRSYFQIVLSLAGWRSETSHEGAGTGLPPGAWWDSGTEFRVTVGEEESVVETRIPFAGLGRTPGPGERWGFQVCRSLHGSSTWSYQYEFFGFRWTLHFGTLAFE